MSDVKPVDLVAIRAHVNTGGNGSGRTIRALANEVEALRIERIALRAGIAAAIDAWSERAIFTNERDLLVRLRTLLSEAS